MNTNPRDRWRATVHRLQLEVCTLSLACRHPGVPVYARLLAAGLVAYAFSPIDLIPDVIPVLGHLDDLVLLPLGVLIVRRMIPENVLADCRVQAEALLRRGRPVHRFGAVLVILSWLALAALGILLAGYWLRLRR
jgi:uncharacterized membrane protein YkvA (DUF1232 family)